jgi:hypothetical protein
MADTLDSILSEELKRDLQYLQTVPEKIIIPLMEAIEKYNDIMGRRSGTVRDAQRSIAELEKAEARLIKKQQELTFQLSELGKKEAELNVQIKAARQNNVEQAQSVSQVTDAYKKLDIEHKKLKAEAKAIGVIYGVTSEQFKQAAAAANEVDKQLKLIDSAVGEHRRNVGNYAESWSGVSQILRELPNLGISTQAFLAGISNNIVQVQDDIRRWRAENALLIEQGEQGIPVWKRFLTVIISWQTALIVGTALLTAYGDDLWKMITAQKKVIDQTTVLKGVNDDVAQSYSQTAAEVENLKNRFFDASATIDDRKQVLKELKAALGDTAGALNNVNDAEKFFVEKSEAYVQAVTLRAQIQGATEAIAKATAENIKNQAKSVEESTNILQKVGAGLFSFGNNLAGKNTLSGGYTDMLKRYADANKAALQVEANDTVNAAQTLSAQLQTQLNAIMKQFDFDFNKKDKPPHEKQFHDFYSQYIESLKARNEAQKEYDVQALKQQMTTSEAIMNNEEETLDNRLKALNDYYTAKNDIEALNAGVELKSLDDEKAVLLQKEADFNSGKLKLTELQQKTLINQIETTDLKINAINERRNSEMLDNEEQANKARLGIITKYGAEEVQAALANLKHIQEGFNYSGNRKNDMKGVLQEQIDYLQEFAAILSEAGVNVDALTNKIAQLQGQLKKFNGGEWEENFKKIAQSANALTSELSETFKAFSDKKIDALEKEGELIDSNLEKELRAIEYRGIAEGKTDKQIADDKLKASQKADAERKKRDNEIRQEKLKQARFDRAASIAEIIANTAAAITKHLGNYVLMAIDAAMGAAQIARVLATPLPSYAEGTLDHKGGKAYVGEGGEKELIQEPSGRTYIVDKPTIKDLPKGTRVFPEHDIIAAGFGMLTPSLLRSLQQQPKQIDKIELSDRSMDRFANKVASRISYNSTVQVYGVDVYELKHIKGRA